MFPITDHLTPTSLAEAVDCLQRHSDYRILAGGTDLFIKMREGRIRDVGLVDLEGVIELQRVTETDHGLRIGAMCTFAELEKHPLLTTHAPALSQAVGEVGGPQIRNAGTIGGNVANGAVSADSVPMLLCLEARVHLVAATGERTIPLRDFYTGPGQTVLACGEILAALELPFSACRGFDGFYYKYAARKAMDIATIGCAVSLKSPDGHAIDEARVAFGVAAPTPVRAPRAEAFLTGKTFNESTSEALLVELATVVQQDIFPRSSWRADEDFRRHIAGQIIGQAVLRALELAARRQS